MTLSTKLAFGPVFDPAFEIPLCKNDLKTLGMFNIVWSQIDVHLVLCICGLLNITTKAGQTFTESMTTGPRLNLFRKNYKNVNLGDDYNSKCKKFCEKMGPMIEKRNHLLHGMWGYYVENKTNNRYPACHYTKTNSNIFDYELKEILEKSCELSYQIYLIMTIIYKIENVGPRSKPREFLFGDGDMPKWIQEAYEQPAQDLNPPDHNQSKP